jgi:integrase
MPYPEPHGKGWRARWKGPEGSATDWPSKSGFTTRRAAKAYAEEQEALVRQGLWIDPALGKQTLAQWWAQWFPAQDFRPNTELAYSQQWRVHIEPRWGKVALRQIRGIDIEKWVKELHGILAASTVNLITSAMRGALESAVFNELIPRSPMPPRKRGRRGAVRALPRRGVVIPLGEIEAILTRLRKDSDRLLVIVALFTGMRWSEVAGMRRAYLTLKPATDSSPASGHYVIDELVGAVHEDRQARRYLGPPKSGPGRIIDLPPFLVALLIAYLATLPAGQDVVFPNRKGEFRHYSSWEKQWRPICDGRPAAVTPRAGTVREAVAPIHVGVVFHDLKHTHKALMNDARVHATMQNYRLGHVEPGAPGVYSHPTELMRRELVDALEAAWQNWTPIRSTPSPPPRAQIPLF